MFWEFVLLISTFALICLRISWSIKERRKTIWLNGPMHLPIIGGGLSIAAIGITRSFNDIYTKAITKYGSFCGFYAGQNYFVLVADPKIATKILSSEDFSSRFSPTSWDSNLYGGPNLGVLHSYGKTAKTVRDLSISKLKQYGTGNTIWMDFIVQDEVKLFLHNWDDKIREEKDICMQGVFARAGVNIIFKILTGDIMRDDKKITQLLSVAESIFYDNPKSVGLLFAFPFLRFLPHVTIYQQASFLWTELQKMSKEILERLRKEGKFRENPSNVIESFLYDQENNKNALTDEQIIWICVDLFLTVLTSLSANHLEWAFLFVTSKQEAYNTAVKEIDSVIGRDRVPVLQDKLKMPYVEATLLETVRLGNIVNYGMRCPLKDVEVNGYHIPKKSQVMIENACLKMDPKIWENPECFQPERFLSSEMKIINTEKLRAFGIRRTCLGEAITKATSFIFFTSLLQHYTFKRSPISSNISFKSASGIMGRPQRYFVQSEARTNNHT